MMHLDWAGRRAALTRRDKAAALVFGTLVAFGGKGYAQTPAQDADAMIQRGVQLRQQGNDDAALEQFRQAYGLVHTPRARAQMALAEQALGRWVDAEAHLNEALAATSDPWIMRNSGPLRESLAAIERHVGSLDVRGNIAGAEVWVNGERAGTLPLAAPLRLEIGTVALEIRAQGYTTVRRNVDIASGVLARESVRLAPTAETETQGNTGEGSPTAAASNGPPATSATTHAATASSQAPGAANSQTSSSGTGNILPGAVVGLGLVTLAGAAIFYGLRASAIGNCTIAGNVLECPTAMDAARARDGGTYTVAGNVLLGVGIGEVAVGAAWFIVRRAMTHEQTPPSAAFRFVPLRDGALLGVEGRF